MVAALLVGLGAFVGGVARYAVSIAFRAQDAAFPWHTFAVNAIGCLAAGIAVGALSGKPEAIQWHLFIVTGVLGGLTTFSAFGLETVSLIKGGNMLGATAYVAATLAAGFAGVYAGLKLAGA
ncbi:MAG: fluoride efflux transporter CrcB [Fimbriimonadales bacterium]